MKIGTRSSAMAMAQTHEIVARLRAAVPGLEPEIVRFKPRGDIDQTSKLDRHGGKGGAFVGEIRDAMRAGELTCAMHSLKDVPGDEETPGLVLGAYLAREAVEDALVLHPDVRLADFERSRAAGLAIGTNSVRRAASLRQLYPQAEIIHYRGAADTRIEKLDSRTPQRMPDGSETRPADALVMAASGLGRVGHAERIAKLFSPGEMLPAVGQGIVVVECRDTDWASRDLLRRIDDPAARAQALAEREMLWVLNGHCNTPIAGYAQIDGGKMHLRGAVMSLDGETVLCAEQTGHADRPRELGRAVGLALITQGADRLIAEADTALDA